MFLGLENTAYENVGGEHGKPHTLEPFEILVLNRQGKVSLSYHTLPPKYALAHTAWLPSATNSSGFRHTCCSCRNEYSLSSSSRNHTKSMAVSDFMGTFFSPRQQGFSVNSPGCPGTWL